MNDWIAKDMRDGVGRDGLGRNGIRPGQIARGRITIGTLRMAVASLAAGLLAFGAVAGQAQIQSVDPDAAIDGDLAGEARDDRYREIEPVNPPRTEVSPDTQWPPATNVPPPNSAQSNVAGQGALPPAQGAAPQAAPAQARSAQSSTTYGEDDLIGAAEGLFGKGAEGLARMIQDVLADQGEPNAYIVGREAGGAFVLGVRYGSGTLYHKVEGERPVYWTGPSVGFDAGANAGNTFILVYNLYDTQQLYERYPAGEGQAYLLGGFNASYLRKDDVVLIPIRVGAGLRLGVNAGYLKFSEKQRWLPF